MGVFSSKCAGALCTLALAASAVSGCRFGYQLVSEDAEGGPRSLAGLGGAGQSLPTQVPAELLALGGAGGVETTGSQAVCGNLVPEEGEDCDVSVPAGQPEICTETCEFDWWNSGFKRRRQFVFDNSGQSESLLKFPVAIRLRPEEIDFSRLGQGGQEIRFVDANDETELPYEIERWDPTGESLIWVSVPSIEGQSALDFIWLYYDNPEASASENAVALWSEYAAAWHLGGDAKDSSGSSEHDGLLVSVMPSVGRLGQSLEFDGVESRVEIGTPSGLNNLFEGGGSISAWIFAETWGESDFGRILDKAITNQGGGGWALQVDNSQGGLNHSLRFEHGFDGLSGGAWETSIASLSLGRWTHVVVVYDNSSRENTPQIYIDGEAQDPALQVMPFGLGASDDSESPLWIGNHSGSADRTFDGSLDEVRMINRALTDDWIAAQFLVGSDLFVSTGLEQSLP